MVNKNGGANILTTAAEGRAEAIATRNAALNHVLELSVAGRLNEIMPWIMRKAMTDEKVMGITLAQLDMAMNGVSYHRALRVIRAMRHAIHDSTVRADGHLTLEWMFDMDDRGCRMAAWLYFIDHRDDGFELAFPKEYPYKPIFDTEPETSSVRSEQL